MGKIADAREATAGPGNSILDWASNFSEHVFALNVLPQLHLAILVGISLAHSLSAGTILRDDVDYADGPLVEVSGGKWGTHSGTTGQVQVVSGRVCLNETNSEDVSASFSGPAGGSALYAGFKVNFDSLPSMDGSYFAHLKGSLNNQFKAKVFALTQGASPGQYRLGLLAGPGDAASVVWSVDLWTNTDYSVVTRYQQSDKTASLWVNASSELNSGVSNTDTGSVFNIISFALREAEFIGKLFLDNLRVGTNFADVVTLLPPTIITQPVNRVTVEGATVQFGVLASGSSPLTYQWLFGGAKLPDATNATLTMSNLTIAQAGSYSVVVSNSVGTTNSQPVAVTIIQGEGGFSLLTYNLQGGTATNWTNNLQAIDRQLSYLRPDIITFQEVQFTNTAAIVNLSYLTNFSLATNSGTDGRNRSVIASRFPIVRSQKWLDGVSLTDFGFDGTFTRDLFEAEIELPNFSNHLHVFTTHLNSGEDSRRAAEASAIANFFVTGFLTTNGNRPYVLTGDMNDDIARPHVQSRPTIPILISPPTGLQLTTPINPASSNELTFSIQSSNGLTKRYDYILPGALLFSNVVSAQVFRTDLLASPPPPLLPGDSAAGSDHLPVMVAFANPYDTTFRLSFISIVNETMTLRWQSVPGWTYDVESSSTLNNWLPFASNILATGTTSTITTNVTGQTGFFRVYRAP